MTCEWVLEVGLQKMRRLWLSRAITIEVESLDTGTQPVALKLIL